MKVVINNCFGGFSLSALATKEVFKRKGIDCYIFLDETRRDSQGKLKMFFTPCSIEEADSGSKFFSAFRVPDPDNRKDDEWDDIYLSGRDIPRNDPDLIAVIEELGEKADGSYAKLGIVEIPDDVEWEISEYDGNEHVAEKHRTWY